MADEIGFDPAAFSVDGARHNGELLRTAHYQATAGAEGITTPGDLKVHELDIPGTQIVIDSGAATILNRHTGERNESYAVTARRLSKLDVMATGSDGGRVDLVIVRVEDPEYNPWQLPAGADAASYQYVRPVILQNVPAGTRRFEQLGLPYAGYALARIDIPVSTGTILDDYITDLREVANPRRARFHDRYDIQYAPSDSAGDINVWNKYPDVPDAQMEVPTWAAKAIVRADITGMQIRDAALAGNFRVKLTGGNPAQTVYSKTTYVNEQVWGDSRRSYAISSSIDIPAEMRGYTISAVTQWQRTGGIGLFRSQADVQVVFDIEFIEAAS